MKFNHVGIPTTTRFEGEIDLPHLRVTVSDHQSNPFGIQWMRYWEDAPVPDLVKTVAHVAFEVDDLEQAVTITFQNTSTRFTYDIALDGVRTIIGLAPGATSSPVTVAANVAHSIQFLRSSTIIGCDRQSDPYPVRQQNAYVCDLTRPTVVPRDLLHSGQRQLKESG